VLVESASTVLVTARPGSVVPPVTTRRVPTIALEMDDARSTESACANAVSTERTVASSLVPSLLMKMVAESHAHPTAFATVRCHANATLVGRGTTVEWHCAPTIVMDKGSASTGPATARLAGLVLTARRRLVLLTAPVVDFARTVCATVKLAGVDKTAAPVTAPTLAAAMASARLVPDVCVTLVGLDLIVRPLPARAIVTQMVSATTAPVDAMKGGPESTAPRRHARNCALAMESVTERTAHASALDSGWAMTAPSRGTTRTRAVLPVVPTSVRMSVPLSLPSVESLVDELAILTAPSVASFRALDEIASTWTALHHRTSGRASVVRVRIVGRPAPRWIWRNCFLLRCSKGRHLVP